MVTPDERRFRDLPSSYPLYRDLMLLAEADGQIIGAVIGVGPPDGPSGQFSVLVKGLGVSENHRGGGVGRKLLGQLEMNAAAMGAVEVHLGAVPSARGFYARLGYSGRSRMHKPLTGAGMARYGAVDERRRQLQLMRDRRADRLAHQSIRPDED